MLGLRVVRFVPLLLHAIYTSAHGSFVYARSPESELRPPPPPTHNVVPLPSHTVNLDLPPEQRWREITEAHRAELIEIMHWWYLTMAQANVTRLKEWLTVHDIDEDYLAELQGIVQAANNTFVTLDSLILLQLIYELDYPQFCTSILAVTPNGTVVHGRNFDYYGEGGLTFTVTFERGGESLFTEITRPGMIGVHSGYRPGSWSVAMNKRTVKVGTGEGSANLAAAHYGGRSYMLQLRRTLEDAADYTTALATLSDAKYMAPVYINLGGAGAFEGAVITIDRFSPGPPPSPDVMKLDNFSNWFLVQANEDHWRLKHGRRHKMATKNLIQAGRKSVSQQMLRKLMTTPPFLFNYMTQFTWVMTPSTGSFDLVLADQSWRRTKRRPFFSRERKRMLNGRTEWDLPENFMTALDEEPDEVSNPAGVR